MSAYQEQATQPGASSPVAQGGVAENPAQPQPVAKPPAGDAAVEVGALPEGAGTPVSTGSVAPDVTAAPSVSVVLEWLPVTSPPENDEWGLALWITSDEGPDDWQDWMAGKYMDGDFLLADDTKVARGAVITHYAIVRGPFG